MLCFLKSVSCSRKNHKFFLEDCLKILNIVSTTDETQELITDLIEGYQSIPADGLIEIIPQIIARLDIVKKGSLCSNFIDMMKRLLVYIGRNHPQTLVFPLLFLRKGNNEFRKKLAVDILHEIVE